MERIDKILRPALAHKGILKQATGAEICFLAEKWGKGRFQAISYSDGLLKLSCASSSASSELHMQTEELMEHINEKLKWKAVRKVRITNRG